MLGFGKKSLGIIKMRLGMNSLGIGEIGEEADKVVNAFTVFENDTFVKVIKQGLIILRKLRCLSGLCKQTET